MAEISSWTPLEKRTATLLTVIGIVGALFSITGIALPYYLFFSTPSLFNWCDSCTNVDSLIARSRFETLAIAVVGTIISFLPRVVYSVYVHRTKRQRV